ncbi:hypothetical protein DRN63_03510 [Nanoarchaeota archaeon]|nr:MAG: hypothetical protein DRN63_03510 [Nanoarchaeota archaeon]
MKTSIDYLDVDVAYLLGLLVARGEFSESGGVKRIVIEFPFRNLEVEGIKEKIVQKDQILLSLRKVTRRINELTDMNVREEEREQAVYLIMETMKNTMFIRNLKALLKGKRSHYEFEIPEEIFQSTTDIQKEFLRGYADVAGSARWANRNKWGRCRVYLDILNPNWRLPVELCHLIQDFLRIPIDTITYGHPNIRDPNLVEYKKGREDAWAREHQIKIFAEEFERIGFYMSHKQKVLQELAEYNRSRRFRKAKFCNPPKKVRSSKPPHPGENSEKLPRELRGRHFDAYWQVCAALGCRRYLNYLKEQTTLPKFANEKGGRQK